ncbi:MAG: phosphoenolpyruvate--protein phosphotransferase [Brevinematales bacterium]|nr:phosphoenolpyruvate--protein phosphotransferase [Brevinematales bacterium]
MIELKGISVSKGLVKGRAYLIEPSLSEFKIQTINPENIDSEIEILKKAIEKTKSELKNIYSNAKGSVEEIGLFFSNILEDSTINSELVELITKEKISAKSSIYRMINNLEYKFKSMTSHSQEKVYDIISVFYRIIKNIDIIKQGPSHSTKSNKENIGNDDYILVGVDIDPTQLLEILQTRNIAGIALERGGSASHASIIAHQHNIPAIFAVKDLTKNVNEDDTIILNANEGKIIVNPDTKTLSSFDVESVKFDQYRKHLLDVLEKPTRTIDRKTCTMMLNISDEYEVSYENTRYYDGVGLFRTEFVFLKKNRFLSEEEQFEIYSLTAEKFIDKPVIIRLLDIGGDKVFEKNLQESKPALGWRSIRILFSRKEELLKQLRAIIRSNIYGNLKILIPMVSSLEEVRKIKYYFNIAVQQLIEENKNVNGNIPIGIMVEIPSVAIMIKEFLNEVDFISIGTNDLTQYTLAVDRNNEVIAEYYEPLNPSVLRLVYRSIRLANKMNKFVSVCGEIAGNPKYTRLLLAMGLKNFSMPQESVPFVKNVIVNTHSAELKKLLEEVNRALTPSEVKKIIENDFHEFQQRIGMTMPML